MTTQLKEHIQSVMIASLEFARFRGEFEMQEKITMITEEPILISIKLIALQNHQTQLYTNTMQAIL